MKQGWTYKKLGEVATFMSGYTPDKKDIFSQGEYPYFKVAEMNIWGNELFMRNTSLFVNNPKKIFPKGTIIFPKNGGAIYTEKKRILEVDSVIDLNTEALFPTKQIDLLFLYYLLSFIKISSFDKGGGLPSLDLRKMSEYSVPVPPLTEQQRIVSRLDAAFAHIDELKANAEKQLSEARALFQKALEKAMEPKEGWEEKTLPDISENLDSIRKPVTKGKRNAGIYPYYGASGIVDYVDDYIFDEDLLCISEDGANLLMRTYPIAFPISGKVWVNNHAHVLRFQSMTTQKYVEYYFSGMKLDEYITGAAQPKLTQKAMNSIIIHMPSLSDQHHIVARLDSLSENVKTLEEIQRKIIAECDALKQALLRKVFE